MLSKCANPGCSASYRYFHNGQLFRIEIPAKQSSHSPDDENGMRKPLRRLEFFWLCDDCAPKWTLAFDQSAGISVRPKFARSAVA
jgi:hypothetical protein